MIAMILAALAIAAPADPNPLALARDGQVQCYTPDVERRVCRAIGAYRFEADGRIINDAENMLSTDPRIILRASSEVYIKGHAVCGSEAFEARHIQRIEVDGVPLEGERFAAARSVIAESMREAIGSGEYCSTYYPKPDGSLLALVTVDGAPRDDAEDTVRWVRLEDGWRVAP